MTDTNTFLNRGIGDLQRSSERFENYNDGFILPDTFLIVRLDAHRYGDWSSLGDEYPCGPTTTRALQATARDLMTSSFRVVLAFQHGDEISLVLDPSENTNPLRRSKVISAFASAAAIHFQQHAGLTATFEAKLAELPSLDRVFEYLFWQRRYSFRNATTIALRKALLASGQSREDAEKRIHGATEEQRLALMESLGTQLSDIPSTTLLGTLLTWETLTRDGREHFKIQIHTQLPMDHAEYFQLIKGKLHKALDINERPVVVEKSKPAPQSRQPKQAKAHQTPHAHRPAEPQKAPAKPSPSVAEYKRNKKAQVSVFRMPSK